DESGRYEFDNLAPGDWKFQVEMLAFAPASKQFLVSEIAPPLDFNLELQAPGAVAKTTGPPSPKPAPATADGTAKPAVSASATASSRPQRPGAGPQRGAGQGAPQGGFRNVNVNQTADTELLAQMGVQG